MYALISYHGSYDTFGVCQLVVCLFGVVVRMVVLLKIYNIVSRLHLNTGKHEKIK